MSPLRCCVRCSRFAPERDAPLPLEAGNHWTIDSNNPHGWLELPNPSTPIQKKSPGKLRGALERKASGVRGWGGAFRSLGQLTGAIRLPSKRKEPHEFHDSD